LLGCASSGYGPNGFFFTYTKLGLYSDAPKGNIFAKACTHSILGLVAWGDASLSEIRSNTEIKVFHTLDLESRSIFGIYASLCLEATGSP